MLFIATLALLGSDLHPRHADAADKRLAVLEFEGRSLDQDVRNAFSDAVRGGAIDAVSGYGILVMTHENMLMLLKEMDKDCHEGDCAVETGRNIGADYVFSGSVARVDQTLTVTLKLHETKSGGLLGLDMVEGNSQMDVLRQLRQSGRALVTTQLIQRAKPVLVSPVATPGKPAEAAPDRAANTAFVLYTKALEKQNAGEPWAAAELYGKACEGGSAQACVRLGKMHELGDGVAKNQDRARELYGKACAGKDAEGCTSQGELECLDKAKDRADGKLKRALPLFEKACSDGSARACRHLADAQAPEQIDRKIALYGKACDGGEGLGCLKLGGLYEKGEGVMKDAKNAGALFSRALELLTKDCQGSRTWACTEIARAYATGRGVSMQAGQAATFYERACDAGEMAACHELGHYHLAGGPSKKVREPGFNIEVLKRPSYAGLFPTRDSDRGLSLLRKACDAKYYGSCGDLAAILRLGLLGVKVDSAAALAIYERACNSDDFLTMAPTGLLTSESLSPCEIAGWMSLVGEGVNVDEERSLRDFKKFCQEPLDSNSPLCKLLGQRKDIPTSLKTTARAIQEVEQKLRQKHRQTSWLQNLPRGAPAFLATTPEEHFEYLGWQAQDSRSAFSPSGIPDGDSCNWGHLRR